MWVDVCASLAAVGVLMEPYYHVDRLKTLSFILIVCQCLFIFSAFYCLSIFIFRFCFYYITAFVRSRSISCHCIPLTVGLLVTSWLQNNFALKQKNRIKCPTSLVHIALRKAFDKRKKGKNKLHRKKNSKRIQVDFMRNRL